jgi:hypothetical protein
MPTSRRRFMQGAAAAAVSGTALNAMANDPAKVAGPKVSDAELRRICEQPVLKLDSVASPVTVASIEVLRNGSDVHAAHALDRRRRSDHRAETPTA